MGLLGQVKRIIEKQPVLYERLFDTLTYNADYAAQKRDRDLYPSRFGGMWTDRSDFEAELQKRKISEGDIQDVRQWRDKGYIIIRNAIAPDMIDAYMSEIEALAGQPDNGLLITSAQTINPVPYTVERQRELTGSRMVDDYVVSEASRALLFHPAITDFLKLVFEASPILTQSLRFDYGSRQPVHQDTAFVRMNAPMKLAAVWIALEDVTTGSGELVFYPGSHLWEDQLFSGRFKYYDASRDGPDQLNRWHQWLRDEAQERGVALERFDAKKGDILLWHAALAHGGGPVKDGYEQITRRSLVGHYCPEGVRPIYHYYAPRQRRLYGPAGQRYTSRYYR